METSPLLAPQATLLHESDEVARCFNEHMTEFELLCFVSRSEGVLSRPCLTVCGRCGRSIGRPPLPLTLAC